MMGRREAQTRPNLLRVQFRQGCPGGSFGQADPRRPRSRLGAHPVLMIRMLIVVTCLRSARSGGCASRCRSIKDVPARTMAVVRSSDFFATSRFEETALATLIHQRRVTPSFGGQVRPYRGENTGPGEDDHGSETFQC